jgi:hypothetical protein
MRFPPYVLPVCLLGMVIALCLPLILRPGESNYTNDETSYYLPAIAQMRPNWPALDLRRDSLSATSPGYPYLLTGISLLTGQGLVAMRLVNLGFSLGVLAVLWLAWDKKADDGLRFAALAPLAFSNFFIKSASNVVTDNPALLAVSATLALVLISRRKSSLAWSCVTGAAAVFCRQNTLWLEAPLAVKAFLGGRWRDAAFLLLPLALTGIFIAAWGGLVPPAWQAQHTGTVVVAATVYHLAVLALLAPFYYAASQPDWRQAGRDPWGWAGGSAALVLALATSTLPSHEAGRWGGYLWDMAARLPAWGDRACLFIVLAPVGGFMLGLLARQLYSRVERDRAVPWLVAQGGFLLAGLANRQVYHRYFEPTQLVLLALWLAMIASVTVRVPTRRRPLLCLAAGQAAVTVVTAYGRTFGFL